jgi:hypothetical protein
MDALGILLKTLVFIWTRGFPFGDLPPVLPLLPILVTAAKRVAAAWFSLP